MEAQAERWQLRSGTWERDPRTETWRLATTPNGTAVNRKLAIADVGRMIRASRDASSRQWFPSDFDYSPQTGTRLDVTIGSLDSPWVPPFGASALSYTTVPLARGLRQTPAPLILTQSNERRDPASDPDRTLPALPPGQYGFLVHQFDVAVPTLMAIDPEHGQLLILLPESKAWMPLDGPTGQVLATGLKNARGWRMEVIEDDRCATLYLPTASGMATVTPTLLGLSYELEYFGTGPALGGPVAWAGEVWLPVLGKQGLVNLVGKPSGSAQPIILPTRAPAPANGFEGPVLDPARVIWPSQEGQLIVRRDEAGKKQPDWIAWPDGLIPAFSLGCPYLSRSGSFWQLCRRGTNEPLEYVQLASPGAQKFAVNEPRVGTGHISYVKDRRLEGDPWREPESGFAGAPTEVVVPLLESDHDRAVVGLRIDAPQGVLALLDSNERQRAVLQLQAVNQADALFGTFSVARPWLASLFVYDAHLWLYHPELPQPLGWKLGKLAFPRKRRFVQGVSPERPVPLAP